MLYVYGLVDPLSLTIRYVGITRCVRTRYKVHMCNRWVHQTKKDLWLRFMRGKPGVWVLEAVPEAEADVREKWWIARLNEQGCNLLNSYIAGPDGKWTLAVDSSQSAEDRLGMPLAQWLETQVGEPSCEVAGRAGFCEQTLVKIARPLGYVSTKGRLCVHRAKEP